MSVSGKQCLIDAIRKELADVLTVRQLDSVLSAMQNAMSTFNVEAVVASDNDGREDDLLEIFLKAKRTEGLSEKTMRQYRYRVSKLIEKTHTPISKITVNHLREFYAGELERGIKESTVRSWQWTFSSMFGWLWREELISKNPCNNMRTIKVPDVQKLPFSPVELETIKEHCKCVRDKAIVMFLLATGCRIEECTKVNRTNINLATKELVVFGKGKKERTVYLDDVSCEILKRYLRTRTDTQPALFIGRRGERLTPNGIRRMLKQIESRSGVSNIHPHRFRRTLATNLANKGMNVQEIACILGHTKIDTTMQYICVQQLNVKAHYQIFAA